MQRAGLKSREQAGSQMLSLTNSLEAKRLTQIQKDMVLWEWTRNAFYLYVFTLL